MAFIGYNHVVEQHPRRRLRSASVQLGALTVLALALSGCNMTSDDDDDDCALGPTGGGGTVALATRVPTPAAEASGRAAAEPVNAAVPERSGFGTHLASCGG
ncbi:hypothetical protein [Micromonospora lutea]|uniref:Uncharacterized protein n=1 Tax=Micromonospora lutea TaxID=419825 RepID=A0ABQ4IUQ8_9ACTN|nr:hypothetical protein [Micromonospora lutea]GIJ21659.1 hypothetical protein Vlu01_22830 [Micromonospora lutea]